MENIKKRTINIKIPNINETGFGLNGTDTRLAWRNECKNKLLAGKDVFNRWQQNLKSYEEKHHSRPINSYRWELYEENNPTPILIDRPTSLFIIDLINFEFNEDLDLNKYIFLTQVLFVNTRFNKKITMNCSLFERGADFSYANFVEDAMFISSTFKISSTFNHSIFKAKALFSKSHFSYATFNEVQFHSDSNFFGAIFNLVAEFNGCLFAGQTNFSGESRYNEPLQFFGDIKFSGSHFWDYVDFSNREFKGKTKFDKYNKLKTIFDKAPIFHNCVLHQGTTFSKAIFPPPSKNDVDSAKAYNTLRYLMSQQQAFKEEQRFFMLELETERFNAAGRVKLLYQIYKLLSNYGFSTYRPAVFLILIPLIISFLFNGYIASNCLPLSHTCKFDPSLVVKTLEFSFLQSLPPLGLDKLSLQLRSDLLSMKPPFDDVILTLETIFQKILSLLGWFFIVLSLRNLFRMKY